jgi:recombination protein RecA
MSGPPAAALKRFEDRYKKTYGADSLMRVSDIPDYHVLPTGSLALDYALGIGGLPEGRIIEYYGPPGIGKTTMAILNMIAAQHQYPDKMVAFFDVEHTFDKNLAVAFGLDPERCYWFESDDAEEVADKVRMVTGNEDQLFSVATLDSIGSMISRAEMEKKADEESVGRVPKIVTRMMKQSNSLCPRNRVTLILINQMRAAIGSYGADTDTPGGWSLKFETTIKVKFKRTATKEFIVKRGEDSFKVGHEVAALVERNKVGPQKRTAVIGLITVPSEEYGPPGIDAPTEAWTLGKMFGVIAQSGAYYTFPDGERIHTEAKAKVYLQEHPEVVGMVREGVLSALKDDAVEPVETEEAEEVKDGVASKFAGAGS